MAEIENMRIHFYGVQGSGSIFPAREEREVTRLHSDLNLLQRVFEDLRAQAAANNGQLDLESAIGGQINRKTLSRYRDRFDLTERPVYGGWTTCFRIETGDGFDLVLDCGSGFRICAADIMAKWGERPDRHLYIFGSHAHFDHTEGFDQAAVCFDPRNHIHVMANHEYLKALDQNLGIFSHRVDIDLKGIQTPLSHELMPASFDSCEILDLEVKPPPLVPDPMVSRYHDINDVIEVGKTRIQPFAVFHPDPCLGYRVEHGGKVFVYCTDHELRRGPDPHDPLQMASAEAEARLIKQTMDADVLYRDGQFLHSEYDGLQGVGSPHGVPRLDWGHSCIEDVISMADACGVRSTYVGHHDPNRTWSEKRWIDETLARQSVRTGRRVELAKAETVLEL